METIFMNTENSKTNKLRMFRLNLSGKLDLKTPNQKYCTTVAKYLRPILVFMWNSTKKKKFKFCFSRVFCYY